MEITTKPPFLIYTTFLFFSVHNIMCICVFLPTLPPCCDLILYSILQKAYLRYVYEHHKSNTLKNIFHSKRLCLLFHHLIIDGIVWLTWKFIFLFVFRRWKKMFRHALKYTLKTFRDNNKKCTCPSETPHIFLRNPAICTHIKKERCRCQSLIAMACHVPRICFFLCVLTVLRIVFIDEQQQQKQIDIHKKYESTTRDRKCQVFFCNRHLCIDVVRFCMLDKMIQKRTRGCVCVCIWIRAK